MRYLRIPVILIAMLAVQTALAQTRKPTAQETAAIRDCVGKYEDEAEIEKNCLYKLVAEPCAEKDPSNLGMADCHRVEGAIWDAILNENYKELMESLEDKEQKQKLREMQRAWIASRDATCGYYWHQIRGSMAIPMGAACHARETARRALLLKAFQGL
jgi:uncharacterized protein YecT (DUF1311 family)